VCERERERERERDRVCVQEEEDNSLFLSLSLVFKPALPSVKKISRNCSFSVIVALLTVARTDFRV
jgi:hypothetical protein